MMNLLAIIMICNITLITCTINPIHKENGVWFPGKGCGTTNEIKYLRNMPEDTTNLACTFVFTTHVPQDLGIEPKKTGGTSTSSPTGTRVMLVGGSVSGANKNDMEIIDVEDSTYTCPKSDNKELKWADHNLNAGGGGLVRFGEGYMPFICGGETNSRGKSDACYQLPSGATEWQEDPTAKLNTKRRSLGYSVLGDKLVISGGDKGGRTNVIDVVKPNEAAIELNSKLPTNVQDLCSVALSDSVLITMGGYTGSRITHTYIIDIDQDKVMRGPDMNLGRQWPACQKMVLGTKAYLVVTGGYFTSIDDSTEFLDVDLLYDGSELDWNKDYQADGIKWTDNGPKLPQALYATRAISLSNSIYTMGGQTPDVSIGTNIFKLTCIGTIDSCSWNEIEGQTPGEKISLRYGRKHHIIIPIEDSMADHLCGNIIEK